MNKQELEKQFTDLKLQNEQYQVALQNNSNIMQQIIGKIQLLDEQEKNGEDVRKANDKPTKEK